LPARKSRAAKSGMDSTIFDGTEQRSQIDVCRASEG
jgi:hypothetical protein